MEGPWTILELAELAAETLAAGQPAALSAGGGSSAGAGVPVGPVRANGRIRDVPNERLVRWYVTVGLVDPPLSRRGRVARYGRRHLLQLVAVKRRQAEGRSLAEIQAELAGATDETLAAVARVPDIRPAPDTRAPEAPAAEALAPEALAPEALAAAPGRFWARQSRQPGRLTVAAAERPGAPAPGAAQGGHADRGADIAPGGLVHGIRLAPGVTLLLEGAGREPGPEDVTEIVNAAQPLLEELASRAPRVPGHPRDVPDPSPGEGSSPRGAGHDH